MTPSGVERVHGCDPDVGGPDGVDSDDPDGGGPGRINDGGSIRYRRQ